MDEREVELKELLKNFKPVNEITVEPTNTYLIDYKENPLNPLLMSYCFENILNFKIKYRIFEKVNYIINFDYKGTLGQVAHEKLSYNFYIDSKYKDEVLGIFTVVKEILEVLFLDNAKISLSNNKFTMENEYYSYFNKFSFFEKRIEELKHKIKDIEKERMAKIDSLNSEDDKFDKRITIFNEYNKKSYDIRQEMLYSIETYIDVFYSFMEHILTLLYPFSKQFNLSISYYEQYIHNTRWTWDKKIKDTLYPIDTIEIIEKLKRIKEIHRNRLSHGLFSRELKAYVYIKDFGRYPLYIGKEYLQGFTEDNDVSLNYDRFLEFKDTFKQFFGLVDNIYQIPMIFIKSQIPIPVNVDSLMKDIKNNEDAQIKANRINFELDNQLNMDW